MGLKLIHVSKRDQCGPFYQQLLSEIMVFSGILLLVYAPTTIKFGLNFHWG